MEKKRYLTAMGRNVENMTVEQLKEVDTAALAKEHADKANKKKEEAERKVKEAARQLDYLVRAVRIEELPRIKEAYDTKIKDDRTRYEQDVVDKATRAKNQWEKDVTEKASLRDSSVFNFTSEFKSSIMAARTGIHEKLCKEEDDRAELEAEQGKLSRARNRKADEAKRVEDARIAAEKAEADRKAEEERQRKEEERRQRQEELEKKERMRMEEQREREQRERTERSRPAPSAGGETGSRYVPPSRRGGGGSRWGGGSGGGSSSDRGGGYGGGRYDGRDSGGGSRPMNSRWS